MLNAPDGFSPHYRKSPVTDPWEPLYSRRRSDGLDFLFTVADAHCNSRGFLHGGVLTTLCDNAMGLSLGTVLNDERAHIVTANLSVDFLGTAKLTETVLIEPRVLRAGGTLGCVDALVHAQDRLIARASATFSVRIIERQS